MTTTTEPATGRDPGVVADGIYQMIARGGEHIDKARRELNRNPAPSATEHALISIATTLSAIACILEAQRSDG